jgi:hypothetical protein
MPKSSRLLYWSPRIICILAILFVSMFAADAFAPELTFWQQITAFLIHLIPSYILIALLVVAWKWEDIGGIIFLIIGIGFSPVLYIHNYHMTHSAWIALSVLSITFPFVLVGTLFLVGHFRKKKNAVISPIDES